MRAPEAAPRCLCRAHGRDHKSTKSAFNSQEIQESLCQDSVFTLASRATEQNEEAVMKDQVVRFMRDETGATAIEYGLIAAGISVAIVLVVQGVGTNLNNTFNNVSNALK